MIRSLSLTPAQSFRHNDTPRFGSRSFWGGAVAIAGLALGLYGAENIRQGLKPSPLSAALESHQQAAVKKMVALHTFDVAADGTKRAFMRAITGDRSSEARLAKGAFKVNRNDQLEAEDQLFKLAG